MSEKVLYYLEQLRKEPRDENAYHSLMELSDSDVPELITTFYEEKNPKIQVVLVEAIWQHRSLEVLVFLQEALRHHYPDVWKAALDGIVAINYPLGIKILADEKARLQSLDEKTVGERLDWIDEAYKQLQETLQNDNP